MDTNTNSGDDTNTNNGGEAGDNNINPGIGPGRRLTAFDPTAHLIDLTDYIPEEFYENEEHI